MLWQINAWVCYIWSIGGLFTVHLCVTCVYCWLSVKMAAGKSKQATLLTAIFWLSYSISRLQTMWHGSYRWQYCGISDKVWSDKVILLDFVCNNTVWMLKLADIIWKKQVLLKKPCKLETCVPLCFFPLSFSCIDYNSCHTGLPGRFHYEERHAIPMSHEMPPASLPFNSLGPSVAYMHR